MTKKKSVVCGVLILFFITALCMAQETKICPKCGAKMIEVSTNNVLTSYPPQYPQIWWCGCGYKEKGRTIRGRTSVELHRERWEKLNK